MNALNHLAMPFMVGYLTISICMIIIGVVGFVYVAIQVHKTNRQFNRARAETEARYRRIMSKVHK
ncbi:hypothetical protein JOD21_002724 [Jeotgalibacillus terrae]|nr:hypothetical protein [Jeotgalibacillus terrae]